MTNPIFGDLAAYKASKARRIKDNADDLDRAFDDIKSRLDNIQRALENPTL